MKKLNREPRPKSLNFKHLHYFLTIAQEGSIKSACKKLGITQSALSGQLKQLEDFLGNSLFDRKVRKLVLNNNGKLALDYANSIFSQSDELVRSFQQPSPSRMTLIRVGVLPSLSKTHIHEFIVPLWKDASICVTIIERKLTELAHDLEENKLEVILSDRPLNSIESQIKSFRLRPRKIVAVASEKYMEAKKNFPESLSQLPMLQLTKHSQIRSDIDQYFQERNIPIRIIGEADDVALLRLAAEKGLGVTVLPLNTVRSALTSNRLIQLGELETIRSDMWAMMRVDGDHNKTLQKVIKRFREKKNIS